MSTTLRWMTFLALLVLHQGHATDERFIAVGYGGARMTSTDGIRWSAPQMLGRPGHDLYLVAATVFNGAVYAVGNPGGITASHDGTHWSPYVRPPGTGHAVFTGLGVIDGHLVIADQFGTIFASRDGRAFVSAGSGPLQKPEDLRQGNCLYRRSIAYGTRLLQIGNYGTYNSMGATIGAIHAGFIAAAAGVRNEPAWAWNGEILLACSASGSIAMTSDGWSWRNATIPMMSSTAAPYTIMWSGTSFLAVRRPRQADLFSLQQAWRSADGMTWTPCEAPKPHAMVERCNHRLFTFASPGMYAGQYLDDTPGRLERESLWGTSTDGLQWQVIDNPHRIVVRAVVHGSLSMVAEPPLIPGPLVKLPELSQRSATSARSTLAPMQRTP